MLATSDASQKATKQEELRRLAVPGSIDVNIMTKVDRSLYRGGEKLPQESSDAMASLRGFAKSDLSSSIIFSAGMNLHLYGYIAQFEDFFPDENGEIKKKIILKVSDYRSAVIQGRFLAKRGLWISEYRIESGLNCGGHAFATDGHVMGPILEEFKQKKHDLIDKLHSMYNKALGAGGRPQTETPHDVRFTVQGGIGTAKEDQFLLRYYDIDGTGWGTPFLLVPEVTNLDEEHLEKLIHATDDDVYLSDSSPLGIPFWNLRISASENKRRRRIEEGKPGSSCPKGFLMLTNDISKIPICRASTAYQKRKLELLEQENPSEEQLAAAKQAIYAKSCLCEDLAGSVQRKLNIIPDATPAVCCGPNITNFSKIASLEEMVSHIYGRLSLLTNPSRPHMFIQELRLYVRHLKKQLEDTSSDMLASSPANLTEFKENLLNAIELLQGYCGANRRRTAGKFPP